MQLPAAPACVLPAPAPFSLLLLAISDYTEKNIKIRRNFEGRHCVPDMKPRAADDDQADLAVPLLAETEVSSNAASPAAAKKPEKKSARFLAGLFVGMVVVGLGNKIFSKLMTQPMRNYPFFLSVYSTFIYLPTSFAYIIPAIIWTKLISPEERKIPQKNWAIMGGLDGISGVMSTFAITNLPGSFVILLQQTPFPSPWFFRIFSSRRATNHTSMQAPLSLLAVSSSFSAPPLAAAERKAISPSNTSLINGTAPPADSSAPIYSNIPVWALVMMLYLHPDDA